MNKKKILTGCFIIIIILGICWIGYSALQKNYKENAPVTLFETFDKLDALEQSKACIRNAIFPDASAVFGFNGDDMIKQYNDTSFLVCAHVDSHTKDHRLIRTIYRCQIIYNPKNGNTDCNIVLLRPIENFNVQLKK